MPNSYKNQRITTKRETKMKKTLLALLSAALLTTVVQPAQAEDQKVLAIIDTAIDSSKFTSIVYEACFSQNLSCPNKTNFMEGTGSASAVVWPKSINDGTYHGDWMTKAALKVDPNIKIVFIRFANVLPTGSSTNRPEALIAAMDWVSKNAEKYSIDALSISQSAVDKTNIGRCTTDKTVINSVNSLTSRNIPVFAATGNDARTDVVGFPSCTNGVIGVGALATSTAFEKATNRGPGLDLVAFGKISITKYNGAQFDLAGSSGATVVSAATYVSKNSSKTFQDYINNLSKVTINNISYSFN